MVKKLTDIIERIEQGHIRAAVESLNGFITEKNLYSLQQPVEEASRDYEMMLQFMAQGFKDPKRIDLLNGIKRKLSDAVCNADVILTRQTFHFYTTLEKRIDAADLSIENIRKQLEDYVAEQAMASIDPSVDLEKLNDDHHKFMSMLFVSICCSKMWTCSESKDYLSLCVSPTVDSRDQQLIVSAITLGCVRFFDKEKWYALSDIYQNSSDDNVVQRAFVGWVITLLNRNIKDKKIEKAIKLNCLDPDTVDAIGQMQMEMLFCSNAEKDQHIINDEIVPGILRNSNYKVTSRGLVELDTDELEEVLHPERTDERLEETQKYFDRMQKMQKNGSDVYFSGFSQMKRFAFFYNLSNWFVPFYAEHPELVRAIKNKDEISLIMKIVDNLPLCNSDRYSFILGISTVIDNLPKDVTKALRSGELREGNLASELNKRTRLLYLQDIYRYAKLFPEQKMFDEKIFESVFCSSSSLLKNVLADKATDLMKAMMRGGFLNQFDMMSREFMSSLNRNLDFQLVTAKRFVELKEYGTAYMSYVLAELMSGGRIDIIKATAKAAMLCGDYGDAAKRYELILKKEPDNLKSQLNYYYAKVCKGDSQDVIEDLFRIEFEAFESKNENLSMNTRRTLALALFCCKRYDESITRYRKIVECDNSTLADKHNLGLALWINGNTKEGLPILIEYINEIAQLDNVSTNKVVEELYGDDKRMLNVYNARFTEDDLRMLCEILLPMVK